ncbi:MAG TPA: isoamylase early set domain-containing protein [Hanamia sp.]
MKKDIIFMLPAQALEGATGAVVLGDFNNWTPSKEFELKKQKDGSFKTVVSLEEGRTFNYRFLLDNGVWENDYNAQNYAPASGLYVENSVITVPVSSKDDLKPKARTENKTEVAKPKATDAAPIKTSAKKAQGPKTEKASSSKKAVTKSAKSTSATEKVKTKK